LAVVVVERGDGDAPEVELFLDAVLDGRVDAFVDACEGSVELPQLMVSTSGSLSSCWSVSP